MGRVKTRWDEKLVNAFIHDIRSTKSCLSRPRHRIPCDPDVHKNASREAFFSSYEKINSATVKFNTIIAILFFFYDRQRQPASAHNRWQEPPGSNAGVVAGHGYSFKRICTQNKEGRGERGREGGEEKNAINETQRRSASH